MGRSLYCHFIVRNGYRVYRNFYVGYFFYFKAVISLGIMRRLYIVAALLLAVSIAACTRENDVVTPDTSLKGGRGGLATVRVTPQLHEKDIDSCIVYVAYANDKMPATMDMFDDTLYVTYQEGRPRATFDSLKKGTYYFYLQAYNDALQESYKGGASFKVVDTTETQYDVYIQVAP